MARRNPKGSREIAVLNLVDGAMTPQLLEHGDPIALAHESRHVDRVRDMLDHWASIRHMEDSVPMHEASLERDWIIGYYYEGLSYRDMSERYGYSHEHIRRTIQRIQIRMREYLEREHEWEDTVE